MKVLKAQQIKDAKHSGVGKAPLKLSDGNGLQLHVFANGRKTWIFSYRYNGKQKNITLGKYPQMTAIVARSNAANLKKQLDESPDQDPSISSKKSKQVELDNSKLFRVVAEQWFMFKKCSHAPTTYGRNLGAIRKHIFPTLGDKSIDDITQDEILDIATKMQANGTIEMAKRVVRLVGQIYKFARRKLKVTKNNPILGLVEELDDHKVKHMPRICILELPRLITDIQRYQGDYTSVSAIKMMMLCFVRTGELRGMEWQEIDWENKLWRIPAERMKGRKPHLVPLSEEALQILNNLKLINSHSKFVFFSSRAKDGMISSHTILGAIKRMGYSGKMTGHGFRGLASTFLHEQGYLSDAIERQLAHVKKDRVSSAYDHSVHLETRREMMGFWSDYLVAKGLVIKAL
jgi:integrase